MAHPKHWTAIAMSNTTDNEGYVMEQMLKNVAWPKGAYFETYPWRKRPYPDVRAANNIITVPRMLPSVE